MHSQVTLVLEVQCGNENPPDSDNLLWRLAVRLQFKQLPFSTSPLRLCLVNKETHSMSLIIYLCEETSPDI